MVLQIATYMGIGYLVCLAALGLINIFVNIKITKSQLKIVLGLMIISFSLVAYSITPTTTGMDITRYFAMLEEMSSMDFVTAMKTGPYANTIITNLLFFVVAKIGDYNLIKFIPTMISMLCISYIIYNSAFKNSSDGKASLVFAFLIFVLGNCSILSIFTGVRSSMAMFIMSTALFRDLYLGKRDLVTWLLYIMPIFIHTGVVLVFGIRILSFVKFRTINYAIIFIPLVLELFLDKFLGINPLLDEIINKYYAYLNMKYETRWIFIFNIIRFTVLSASMAYLINNKFNNWFNNPKTTKTFLLNLILTQIGSMSINHLFLRNNTFIIVSAVPLLYLYLTNKKMTNGSWLIPGESSLIVYNNGKSNKKRVIFAILIAITGFSIVIQYLGFKAWILQF